MSPVDERSRPLVSVVVPTYDRARLLGHALESVFGQTHRDLELIVVDDGSTDETPSYLASLTDPRLRAPNLLYLWAFRRSFSRGLSSVLQDSSNTLEQRE